MEFNKVITLLGITLALTGCTVAPKNPDIYTQEPPLPANIERGDFPPSEPIEDKPAAKRQRTPEEIERAAARRQARLLQQQEEAQHAAVLESTSPTNPPQQVTNLNWQPNEGHLIRGNELIGGLQRDIGRKPSATEMQSRLQSHMGLSATQAQKVIAALGY